MSARLRAMLDSMTWEDAPLETHRQELETIAAKIPHNIHVVPTPFEEPLQNFNCVMHAFGLIGQIEPPCSAASGRYYADMNFLAYLIDQGVLQPCKRTAGALIVWSAAGTVKHVGVIVAPGCASSKWGTSHVFEHGFLEVPTSFGEQLDCYAAIAIEVALDHLVQFWTAGRVA